MLHYLLATDNPQIGFLLSCKRRFGHVFCRRARTDRHRLLAGAGVATQHLVRPQHLILQLGGRLAELEQPTDRLSRALLLRKRLAFPNETFEVGCQAVALDVLAVGHGGHHEAGRYPESLPQEGFQSHGFTAHQPNAVRRAMVQPDDVWFIRHGSSPARLCHRR